MKGKYEKIIKYSLTISSVLFQNDVFDNLLFFLLSKHLTFSISFNVGIVF